MSRTLVAPSLGALVIAGLAACSPAPAPVTLSLGPAADPLAVTGISVACTVTQDGKVVSSTSEQGLDLTNGVATANLDFHDVKAGVPADFHLEVTWAVQSGRVLLVADKVVPSVAPGSTIDIGNADVQSRPDTDNDGYGDLAEVLAGTNPDDATSYPGSSQAVGCGTGPACTGGLVCIANACITNPCAGIVSGQACGAGANASVTFTCSNGDIASNTSCPAGNVCLPGATQGTTYCAQWAPQPSPTTTDALAAAIFFNGVLEVLSITGHLYAYTGGTWTEDMGFAAAEGTPPAQVAVSVYHLAKANPGGGADSHLYVSGPAGLLMHSDASGNWTKIATGTTVDLHRIATSGTAAALNVWVTGDAGTWLTNTANDPVTFSAGVMQASGAIVTAGLYSMVLPSPTGIAGGSGTAVFHMPSGGGWIADTTDLPAGTLGGVRDMLRPTPSTALAVHSKGYVLAADLSAPSSPILWSTVYTPPSGPIAIAQSGGKVFVVGLNGVAAVRDTTGTWSASTTGQTQNLNDLAVNVNPAEIVAVGAAGTVLKYVGP